MKLGKLDAPGLECRHRPGGRTDRYWVAKQRAARNGFAPRTVRIPDGYDDAATAGLCQRLQREMIDWLAGSCRRDSKVEHKDDGTVRWLCTVFETDPDSPFRARRPATRTFYRQYLKKLTATAGDVGVNAIVGKDVRRWYRVWTEAHGERGAYGCVQTLRRAAAYGVSDYSDERCMRLGLMLKNLRFSPPRGRTKRPTFNQIAALRAAAHEAGRPSIALAITLQFEVGLRQKDVIGEWTGEGTSPVHWTWGLTWEHIDSDLVLRKPTSKSNGRSVAVFDIKKSPDLLAEMQRLTRGIGPTPLVVREETRRPWTTSQFSRAFAKLKAKAGWPADVWNMDSRAGAVSEAFEAGAAGDDVMKMATHTQRSTTEVYNRGNIVQASRVAELRQAKRQKPEG